MSEAEQRWLLKAIREAGGELESQFGELDDEVLRWRPVADEWCITEVLGHVRDAERVYLERLERLTREHHPMLPNIDIESLPQELDYREASASRFLREFAHHRRETVMLLWSLTPREWERAGEHEYRGPLSVLDVARDINRHDLEHLWQARRLVRSYEEHAGLPAGTLLE